MSFADLPPATRLKSSSTFSWVSGLYPAVALDALLHVYHELGSRDAAVLLDVYVLDDARRTLFEHREQLGEHAALHVRLDLFVAVDVQAADQQAVVDSVDLLGEVLGDAQVVLEALLLPVAEALVRLDVQVEQHDPEARQTDVLGVVVVAQPLLERDSGEPGLLVLFELLVDLRENRRGVRELFQPVAGLEAARVEPEPLLELFGRYGVAFVCVDVVEEHVGFGLLDGVVELEEQEEELLRDLGLPCGPASWSCFCLRARRARAD